MKKIVVGLFVVAMAASSQAAWLYWQIDSPVTMGNTGAEYTLGKEYNAGKIYATTGGEGSALLIADTTGTSTERTMVADTESYAVNLSQLTGTLSSYSFYIEYVNYSDGSAEQIAIGETTSYETLSSNGYIMDEWSTTAPAIWHGGTINAPEPTSALLMMLGVAGLALKRKQRKVNEV